LFLARAGYNGDMLKTTLFQILLFSGVGLIFGGILATLSLVVQKVFSIGRQKSQLKKQVYECGMRPIGKSQVQFDLKYYVFALIFIVFDVEFVFLMPWALSLAKADKPSLGFLITEAFLFIFILGLGLIYAWRKKALEWK
jgi:NADH:ubiquinone oxidoreductase subunit 3 (subunit A)